MKNKYNVNDYIETRPEAIEAIKESIEHWWQNYMIVYFVHDTDQNHIMIGAFGYQNMSSSCSLCSSYIKHNCTKCPIRRAAVSTLCKRTPWTSTPSAWVSVEWISEDTLDNILKEIEFLYSLLPEGER